MEIRAARREDLTAIVTLLAADPLGAAREGTADPVDPAYIRAFEDSAAQAGNMILVGTDKAGAVVACLQLYLLPGLTRRGMRRAQIEGVRVAATHRGRGLGEALIGHAIDESRKAGCALVQLTTDITREDAHRFYERLGFERTHWGMKLILAGEE